MSQEEYYLHRDGKGRFFLQNATTGIVEGLLFPAMPGESAHAFAYDYGSVWYPKQLRNLADFPELADLPFFTIESCAHYQLSPYFQQTEFQSLWPLLGSFAKYTYFSLDIKDVSSSPNRVYSIVWQYTVPNPNGCWTIPILDLWVNNQGCWFCTREGQVLGINHHGELIQKYDLPKLTRCLTGNEDVPYVSCDDGHLYDLTAKLPQSIHTVRPVHDYSYTYPILAIEQSPDAWFIADIYGNLQTLNSDLVLQWQHQTDYWQSCFLQSDAETVYLGHYYGVNAYHLKTGHEQWMQLLEAPVLCGVLTQQEVIVGCSDQRIYGLQKIADAQTGEPIIRTIYTCTGMPYALTLAADEQSFFVGDYTGKIEQLDLNGSLQTTIQTQTGAITALKCWGDRLYITTAQGHLICLEYLA